MSATQRNNVAVWAITPNGSKLAGNIHQGLPDTDVYLSQNLEATIDDYQPFQNLAESIKQRFYQYSGHIFIMSTGIVVRLTAPLVRHKSKDPAVVVVDDRGHHAISLLSGHLGGANELTRQIADIIGANPVITTATDVNQVPAIDIIAKENKLFIENPAAIKTVNMAILKNEKIYIHDPFNILRENLPNTEFRNYRDYKIHPREGHQRHEIDRDPGVFIDDVRINLPPQVLVLRPASLVAGIGCNRNTATAEIRSLLEGAIAAGNLALSSLKCLASIDLKADEDGLIKLGADLELPIIFFKQDELNQVKSILNPSTVVEKHVGVKSVCEASAILAARNGNLIIPKQTSRNVTVAIARIDFT